MTGKAKGEQGHDSIPPPNEHATALATQWVELANRSPYEAIAILEQHIAEHWWLRNMVHHRGQWATQEGDT